ncbi:hypothetical protein UFOVP421_29 [uncultured Caudovirales phage]|uniref:DUF1376 domain-containing protein n=1 Tax=uncultured Caudovirales phage TaxID=2100421 RepID=A0A6J5M708_9CAUD|nr:hypothetical protein UFOVP421_29 [uncultured Caudovirales phage]
MLAMSDLPPPLVPADCDLRGYEFMPLFGHKLFGSDFYVRATDAEFRAAIRLWWAAWQQCPAGSLPTDDAALALLADYGRDVRGFAKVRSVALDGFILCSDGRLYHPVLCAEAAFAYERRVKERVRKAALRKSKGNAQVVENTDAAPAVSRGTSAGRHADGVGTGQDRTGQDNKETYVSPSSRQRADAARPDADFDRFWTLYPRKVGKGAARRAWTAALRRAEEGSASILAGITVQTSLDRFDMRDDGRFVPHPATWLNGDRWLDGMEPDLNEATLDRRHSP